MPLGQWTGSCPTLGASLRWEAKAQPEGPARGGRAPGLLGAPSLLWGAATALTKLWSGGETVGKPRGPSLSWEVGGPSLVHSSGFLGPASGTPRPSSSCTTSKRQFT